MTVSEIEPAALAADRTRRDWCVLDVREYWELDIVRIDGSLHIPLGELANRIEDIPSDRPVAVLCHSGMRSARAAAFLHQSGRPEIYNVGGGIDRWATDVDPSLARY